MTCKCYTFSLFESLAAATAAKPAVGRWVHSSHVVGEETMAELVRSRQYIGQLELLAAVAVYYSLPELAGRRVLHWIDNTAAMFGMAKGYSSRPDSARIIHSFYALVAHSRTDVWFEYVRTDANIADLPSRGQYDYLVSELRSEGVVTRVPPLSFWSSPEEAARAAGWTQDQARSRARKRKSSC